MRRMAVKRERRIRTAVFFIIIFNAKARRRRG
jgi:hypothetical protein